MIHWSRSSGCHSQRKGFRRSENSPGSKTSPELQTVIDVSAVKVAEQLSEGPRGPPEVQNVIDVSAVQVAEQVVELPYPRERFRRSDQRPRSKTGPEVQIVIDVSAVKVGERVVEMCVYVWAWIG